MLWTLPASASPTQNPPQASTPAASPAPAHPANAILNVLSGLPNPVGGPNPLAGHTFLLLRESYADVIRKSGVTVPAGVSPYSYVSTSCAQKSPDCAKIRSAVTESTAYAVRADIDGNATFPLLPAGTYYLMVTGRHGKKAVVWVQSVQVKPGRNNIRLDQNNATPLD